MRRPLTILAVAVLGSGAALALSASPVGAVAVTTNCANLQATLNGSAAGDVITLHDVTRCLGTFTLPSHAITLQGQTQADGFEGIAGPGTDLTGANVGATTLTNLTFTGGQAASSGGALAITGTSSPTISHCIFVHNHADRAGAASIVVIGAVVLDSNVFGGTGATDPNIAAHSPGAVALQVTGSVSVTGNTFTNNVASIGSNAYQGGGAISAIATTTMTFNNNVLTGNQSLLGGAGGAATLLGQTVVLSGNTFRANTIGPPAASNSPTNFGGGVAVFGNNVSATLTQSHNLFDSNTVHAAASSGTAFDFGGGGEWTVVSNVSSFSDTFINNHVDAGVNGSTAVGGGLGIQGINAANSSTVQATDLAASTNSVGAKGEGGGIYAGFGAGCFNPPCVTNMTLADSTVDANSVGAGGSGAGVAADPVTDVTNVVNSIVYGNTGTPAQLVSGTLTVGFSDSCNTAGAAYPGSGNVCTDPKLTNPAANDLHETITSPTINAGSNGIIPAGLTVDFDGDARVQNVVVDMGADEFPLPVPTTGAAADTAPAAAGWSLLSLGLVIVAAGATTARRRRTTQPKPR